MLKCVYYRRKLNHSWRATNIEVFLHIDNKLNQTVQCPDLTGKGYCPSIALFSPRQPILFSLLCENQQLHLYQIFGTL